jgi:hypothetical protein
VSVRLLVYVPPCLEGAIEYQHPGDLLAQREAQKRREEAAAQNAPSPPFSPRSQR